MGKLKIIKTGPMATIQDVGRFGFRRYGIPQSGAMDKEWMIAANQMTGNPTDYPVVEFAIIGMTLEAMEKTAVSVMGAHICVNGKRRDQRAVILCAGDILEVSPPHHVYGYLGMDGRIQAKQDFGSVSTYPMAGFGGLQGSALKAGDELVSKGLEVKIKKIKTPDRANADPAIIHIIKGPEWGMLKESPDRKKFEIDRASNRMGIRLNGRLDCDFREIASSPVIPGTIQLPANGHPIILMNDCQTTGGYPRIGKVIQEDLGKISQIKKGTQVTLIPFRNTSPVILFLSGNS